MKKKKIIFEIGIICFLVTIAILISKNYIPSQVKNYNEERNEEFDSFLNDIVKNELNSSLLNLYINVEEPKNFVSDKIISLYPKLEENSYLVLLNDYEKCLENLDKFDYDKLSYQQKITYDIMEKYWEDMIETKDYYLYQEPFSPITGIHIQIPNYITQLPLESNEEVKRYFEILMGINEFFDEAIELQEKKVESNICMDEEVLELVIQQCNDMLKNDINDYFIDWFDEQIQNSCILDNDEKEKYIEENKQIVKECVVPAYENIARCLKKIDIKNEKKTATYSNGNGRRYYELLLNTSVGIEKDAYAMIEEINQQLKNYDEQIRSIENQYPMIKERALEIQSSKIDCNQVIFDLEKKSQKDFYVLDKNIKYDILMIQDSIKQYMPEAYYITPRLDSDYGGDIYIKTEQSNIEGYVTLAHEGFPGHLYQINYSRNVSGNKIRSITSYYGFTEGWGVYAELYGYKYFGLDDILSQYLICKKLQELCIYARVDLGVNIENWDVQEIINNISYCIDSDEASAIRLKQIVSGEPTYYLSYYVGYEKIEELKNKCIEELGAEFDIREFHHKILSIGSAHFDIVEKYIDIWINEEKATCTYKQ